MKKRFRWELGLAAALAVTTAFAQPSGLEEAIDFLEGPTRTDAKFYLVAPVEGKGITGGGIALDHAGNVYLSDVGVGVGGGSIIMLPSDGSTPVRIMRGLTSPTDVEITPDGRALLISGPSGQVVKRYFGVSVRVSFSAGIVPRDPVAFLKTDQGTLVGRLSGDGYFHFPGVLEEQQRVTVDLVIKNGVFSQPYHGRLLLLSPSVEPAGHTILEEVF